MSLTRLPQLGSVVWAELEDANGFRKVRPAVVITATADIVGGVRTAFECERRRGEHLKGRLLPVWSLDDSGRAREDGGPAA